MVKFLGIAKVDFKDDKTGDEIHGYNFWFSEPNMGNKCVGYKPFKKFFNDRTFEEFSKQYGGLQGFEQYVNKDCTVIFNQYGKVQEIMFK